MFPPLDISLSISSHIFISFSLLAILASVVFRAIYNLFFSPLSSIPGPWYAAVSDAWMMYHVVRLEQCKTVHQLFETYGPVVRVGPNKVVFRDLTSSRNVYNHHKFNKSSYYKSLLTNNNDHAMTTLEHAPHSARRKAYSPHYHPTNISLHQPEIHEAVLETVEKLNALAGKSTVECLQLFRHLAIDIVVNFSSGFHPGSVKKWASGNEDTLSVAISDFPKRGVMRSAVPTWAWNLVCRIPVRRWRQLCDSDKIMAEFISARVYDMRADMKSGKVGDSEKTPLLQRLLSHRYPSGELVPEAHVVSEAMGHLIAGSDTSSISLSYFLWELTRRADVARKLRAELDDAMPDACTIPDITVLNRLPYLNAFVKEGLRIYGAAPSLLERVVPESASNLESFDIMGYPLAPGTIVATQAWSVHRDALVFPSPNTFLPERWLEIQTPHWNNSAELAKMNQHMMAFGTGSRVCGGQNLAQAMLRIIIATLVRNFDISAPAETNERSMEMRDSFVLFPAAMECKLVFTPRKHM